MDISKLHNKLHSVIDSEASRGTQYEIDVYSIDHDLKYLEWFQRSYSKENLKYYREYLKETKQEGDKQKESIFEKTFKLIQELLIPLAHQNHYKNPQIVLKPFHEHERHLFISLEIKYFYFEDLQDFSKALAEHGFIIGSIDPINEERFSIGIQLKEEEESS